MMRLNRQIARRYARAFISACADRFVARQLAAQLDIMAAALQVPAAKLFFRDPSAPASDQVDVLLQIYTTLNANPHPVVERFLAHILARRRIEYLILIHQEVVRHLDRAENHLVLSLRTARQLEPAVIERLAAVLSQVTGQLTQLVPRLDPTILGGFVAECDTCSVDGSLRTQIESLLEDSSPQH